MRLKMPYRSVLMLGCGNMGGAMLRGWLNAGLCPDIFTIVDPFLQAAPDGVRLLRAVPEESFAAAILGVKPQLLDEVAASFEPVLGEENTLFSILAGVELGSLRAFFPRARHIVRVMPNLAAALGKSPVALASRDADNPTLRDEASSFMGALGRAEWLDESLFDLVTALVGSGPAFAYRFMDALASGATALGMPADQAERLTLAMMEGAALLAASADEGPGALAQRVASPGGTTEAGLMQLDEDAALARLMEKTLRAARDRGTELAAVAREENRKS